MRRLLLLRHAKAAPPGSVADFDRPLTERGRAQAARVGAWLAHWSAFPDYGLYSGAVRTRETFEIVARAQSRRFAAVEQNALYEASRAGIVSLLRDLPADAGVVLIVGHNPGIADVADWLAEKDGLRAAFSPGALAALAFDLEKWSALSAGCGRWEAFVTPEN